jgi:hypothetical protein
LHAPPSTGAGPREVTLWCNTLSIYQHGVAHLVHVHAVVLLHHRLLHMGMAPDKGGTACHAFVTYVPCHVVACGLPVRGRASDARAAAAADPYLLQSMHTNKLVKCHHCILVCVFDDTKCMHGHTYPWEGARHTFTFSMHCSMHCRARLHAPSAPYGRMFLRPSGRGG